MKTGDRVCIFEDPITAKRLEGLATITKILFENEEFVRVSVIFADDPGGVPVERIKYK